jgi:hypothetical protein
VPDDVQKAQQRLKRAEDAKRRRAMGKPLPLSDADLDDLSTVSPADVKAADADARRHGSPLFNALLNAQPRDDA